MCHHYLGRTPNFEWVSPKKIMRPTLRQAVLRGSWLKKITRQTFRQAVFRASLLKKIAIIIKSPMRKLTPEKPEAKPEEGEREEKERRGRERGGERGRSGASGRGARR